MAHDAVREGNIFWSWTTDLGANRPGIADNKVAADHYLPASGQEVCSFPKVNQFLS